MSCCGAKQKTDSGAAVPLDVEETTPRRRVDLDARIADGNWDDDNSRTFTMVSGKYEDRDASKHLDDSEDGYEELDDYLLRMSPIVPPIGKRGEKGPMKNSTRTAGTISVRCTPSSEEIVGTPSEVAFRLSSDLENRLSTRRDKLQREIDRETTALLEDEPDAESDEEIDEDDAEEPCPAALELEEDCPKRHRCPGTLDLLSRKLVPCRKAPTLREIALGRRMPRARSSRRSSNVPESPIEMEEDAPKGRKGVKSSCCCQKKKGRKEERGENEKKEPPEKIGSCCPRRNSKHVTWAR